MSTNANEYDAQCDGELKSFLATFFGGGNEISLKDATNYLSPWIDRLGRNPRSASVLPRKRTPRDQSPVYQLYVLSFDRQEAHELSLHLASFLGATLSSFSGLRATLDRSDPFENAVIAFTGGHAFRFRIETSTEELKKQVFDRLSVMRTLWDERPDSLSVNARPRDQVLRDFYMALTAGNRASAEKWLQWIADHAMLDASNLLFLRVQMLGALGADDELLDHPDLAMLMKMRRPPSVTQALLEAVYRRYLEKVDSAQEAIEVFTQEIRPRFVGLLHASVGIQSSEAGVCLALNAAVAPADWSVVDQFAATAPKSSAGELLRQIAALAPQRASSEHREQELIDLGDRAAKYRAALKMPPSAEKCIILMQYAIETGAIAPRTETLRSLGEIPRAEREKVARAASTWVEWLRFDDKTTQTAPRGWHEWLTKLNDHGPWESAIDIVSAGANEWPIDMVAHSDGGENRLQQLLLVCRPQLSAELFDRALPHLVRWLMSDTLWPRPAYRALYEAVLACLVSIDRPSIDDLTVTTEIMSAVVETGAQSASDLVRDATGLMERVRAPWLTDWALDLIDMFLERCGEPSVLYPLLDQLEKWFRAFPSRIGKSQQMLASALATELDDHNWESRLAESVGEFQEDRSAVDPLEELNGTSILIYTLTRGAGDRARNVILSMAPNARVNLSDDKVATTRLKEAATNADFIVFTSRSATHAASDAIRKASESDDLIYANGKGCASIVAALRDAAAGRRKSSDG